MSDMKNNMKEIITIALKLLIICSIVAVIVASVNFITKDRIIFNEKQNTADALTEIYAEDSGNRFEVSDKNFVMKDEEKVILTCSQENFEFSSQDIKAFYILKNADSQVESYCISVQPMGFKDYIKMLVAINPNCTVKAVRVVSMAETSGIGTKACEASFLDKFTNLNDTQVSHDVDIISGATKTSRPVIDAVAASLRETSQYISKVGGEAK